VALPRFSGSGNLRPAGSAHLGFLFGLAFINTTLWGIPARVIHGTIALRQHFLGDEEPVGT